MQHERNIKPTNKKKIGTLKISQNVKIGNIDTNTFDIMRPDFYQGFEIVGETDPNTVASLLLEMCSEPKVTIEDLSGLPDGNMEGLISMAKHVIQMVSDAIIKDEKSNNDDSYKLLYPFTVANREVKELIFMPRKLGDIYKLKTESADKADFAQSFIQGFCKIKGSEDEPILDAMIKNIDFLDAIVIATTISRKKSLETSSNFIPTSE